MNNLHSTPGGIYVHIPFCERKCPYCDFYSITDLSLRKGFIDALEREIEMTDAGALHFDSLYIGGGTPSLLVPDDIGRIVDTVLEAFTFSADVEITLEVNPATVDFDKIGGYRQAGINRLNIGVQSFQNRNLKFLGRIHNSTEAEEAVTLARKAGFDNIGLDLIYGLPGQTRAEWIGDLRRAVDLHPEHLSCYMLTFETGTPLDINRQQGRVVPLPEAEVGRLFELTVEFLQDHGYCQYEISNFGAVRAPAGEPMVSRHNQKYWTFAPYLGFGPGAHSFVAPERYWKYRDVSLYMQYLAAGRLPVEEKERLTGEQLMIEAIYLGLRMTRGIDLDKFTAMFNLDFRHVFQETIAGFEKDGLLTVSNRYCFLTRKGMALLDSITPAFTSQDIKLLS